MSQNKNQIIIEGKVIDSENDQPLPGVVCFLKSNQHVGILTDSSGFIFLKVPREFSSDTLVISFLGYEKLLIPLNSYHQEDKLQTFLLTRNAIVLKDVLVQSNDGALKEIVLKAVRDIPKNYPNKFHQLKGLFRKLSTENNEYTHLEEASIRIQDKGYGTSAPLASIEATAFRESFELGKIDSLSLNALEKINKNAVDIWGSQINPLYILYAGNYIRNHKSISNRFNYKTFKKSIDKHYIFELENIYVEEGDTIYHISFSEGYVPAQPSGNSYFKIRKTDNAIIDWKICGFSNGHLNHEINVKYQKYKGRYYPKYIKRIFPRAINQEYYDGEYDISTFWFDSVQLKGIKKIKTKQKVDPLIDKIKDDSNYQPVFWENYYMLKKYPLSIDAKRSLEKEKSLDEQFYIQLK